ncbi:MAG TPA: ABC transporter ATP-binding protein [Candidatus Pacearchaeota archaeon]|mgnify:FL=1|nr:ABC transporter ATP-binding protein [Candidatus Pacearchaeota archaeon]
MSKKKKPTFKDYISVAKWSVSANWKMSPSLTIINFLATIYSNLSGLIYTYITAKLIDQIIELVQTPQPDIKTIYPMIVLLGGVEFFNAGMIALNSYAARVRRRIYGPYFSKLYYEKVYSLGVQTNQLPDISNKRRLTEEWMYEIADLNTSIVRIVASIIRGIIAASIIFSFSKTLGIAMILIAIISYLQNRHYFLKDFKWQTSDKNIQERRKVGRIGYQLSDPLSIGEISIVGAFKYLDSKYINFYNYYNNEIKKIVRQDSITTFLVDILNVFAVMGGCLQVFKMAIERKISIGDTTFFVSSISNFYSSMKNMTAELVMFLDSVTKGKQVVEFFNLQPLVSDGSIKLERLVTPPSIDVNNITFRYPGSHRDIFKNFSMKIESGQKVAIVGENGAGKSTLVKLLCRMYDPQEGKILINGIDLKELSINDWYKNVGTLFQDFNFYSSLTVEENIYIGKSVKEIDRKKIVASAKNAEAHEFIMKYKKKYNTVMSEDFKDGVKPSHGQKQKIAIARFFYRDTPLVIFDEPTSSIDADSEFRIFNRIYKFFNKKTVIIISHRFSTVRKADVIFVIKDGKLIEKGSHRELMERKGVYFRNFTVQAEGYKD